RLGVLELVLELLLQHLAEPAAEADQVAQRSPGPMAGAKTAQVSAAQEPAEAGERRHPQPGRVLAVLALPGQFLKAALLDLRQLVREVRAGGVLEQLVERGMLLAQVVQDLVPVP